MPRAPRPLGSYNKGHVTLSLCMIVKNEAQTLERCLSLARPHVDEIVVVDTGSTDGTREIARRYADVFDEIEWPGSFSEARNHSLGLASGDFILILDGDEYMPDARHWKRLRRKLLEPSTGALQLLVRNEMPAGEVIGADRIVQERVFRNHPQIRYEGKVHNQISAALLAYLERTGERLVAVEAEVIHTGYALAQDRMKVKYRPRVELLRAEYERPRSALHRAYYGYQLGVVLFVLEELKEAATVFNAIDYGQLTPDNAFYTHLLAAQTALKLENATMALAHSNGMLAIQRNEPIAYYTTGLALMMAGRIGDGLFMLMEAVELNDTAGSAIRFVLNPAKMLDILAVLCSRARLRDHAVAFRHLQEKHAYDAASVRALLTALRTIIVQAEMESAGA